MFRKYKFRDDHIRELLSQAKPRSEMRSLLIEGDTPKKAANDIESLLSEATAKWTFFCKTRDQNSLRAYLKEVYRIGLSLGSRKKCRRLTKKCARAGGLAARKSLDVFTAVIAASTIKDPIDAKCRSRWSRALRYLASQAVELCRFIRFLKKNGGICGAADRFADARRE